MSLFPATTGVRVVQDIILAVEPTTANAADEVREGAVVKAVYFELWAIGESGTQTSIVTVTKDIGGANGPSFGQITGLNAYTNKKNVLFTHQGITGNDGVSGPNAILRGWVKIPKSKQRFGLGDALHLTCASQGDATVNFCGFAIYKEYT